MGDLRIPYTIISGGQTGVDRAALDAAVQMEIAFSGFCPAGRKAEDGPLEKQYHLIETVSDDYHERTEKNIKASDGTLILHQGTLDKGTEYTLCIAKEQKRPVVIIDLRKENMQKAVSDWITTNNIMILNIAGPRESNSPGIYQLSVDFLCNMFSVI